MRVESNGVLPIPASTELRAQRTVDRERSPGDPGNGPVRSCRFAPGRCPTGGSALAGSRRRRAARPERSDRRRRAAAAVLLVCSSRTFTKSRSPGAYLAAPGCPFAHP